MEVNKLSLSICNNTGKHYVRTTSLVYNLEDRLSHTAKEIRFSINSLIHSFVYGLWKTTYIHFYFSY